MAILGWILIAVGGIMGLIYGIQLIIMAFKTSVLWGLGYLFLWLPVGLIYIIMHWQQTKKPFLMNLLAAVIMIAGFALVAPSMAEAAAAADQSALTP